MQPVELTQAVLDRLKTMPIATVYYAVRYYGSSIMVCEGVLRLTPGERFAAGARALRFLPIQPDLLAEVSKGAESPEYLAMGRCVRAKLWWWR